MDYNVKLPDGSEIVMLYTKKFNWKDKKQQKILQDAPTAGRVYRALKTKEDTAYYIHLNLPLKKGTKRIDGIRVTALDYTAPEWECTFIEIDEENIVDLDITSEDYQNIGQWIETKQEDMINKLFKQDGVDVIASEEDEIEEGQDGSFHVTEHNDLMDIYKKSLEPYDSKAISAIQFISMRDPFALQAFSKILTKYLDFMDMEDKSEIQPIRRDICTSNDLGRTANMAILAKHLDKYLRTKEEDEDSLFEMMLPLVFEYMRTEINKPFDNE